MADAVAYAGALGEAVALGLAEGGHITRAHVYLLYESRAELDRAERSLLANGFEPVRRSGRRYDYHSGEFAWDAELASGGVGVYLRTFDLG